MSDRPEEPDWNAPETAFDTTRYYMSETALGRLFRQINLPAVATARTTQDEQRRRFDHRVDLDNVRKAFHQREDNNTNLLYTAIRTTVAPVIPIHGHDDALITEMWTLYARYTSELRTVCMDYALSRARGAMLSEEEVVIGTIVAKTPQPRWRTDQMTRMRARSTALVDSVHADLQGEDGMLPARSLERAWVAYRLANIEDDTFGARSFAWIALGDIFEALRAIKDEGSDSEDND